MFTGMAVDVSLQNYKFCAHSTLPNAFKLMPMYVCDNANRIYYNFGSTKQNFNYEN